MEMEIFVDDNSVNSEIELEAQVKGLQETYYFRKYQSKDDFPTIADIRCIYFDYETKGIWLYHPEENKYIRYCGASGCSCEGGDTATIETDKPLVSPILSGEISPTPGTPQPLKSITVEFGTVVRAGIKYKWTADTNKKSPESVSGIFTELTDDGQLSGTLLVENITANRTLKVNLHAPQKGFKVVDDKVVPATGVDTASASVTITFAHKIYHGCAASFDTDDLDSLLSNSRARTLSNITTASDEYYYYAYPKTLGELTTVIQNGATPILGAFVRTEIEINNAAGTAVEYYLYTLRNIGSLTNSNSLKFE